MLTITNFSFLEPMASALQTNFRHTWTAFSSLTFICLLPASEHLFLYFFFWINIDE